MRSMTGFGAATLARRGMRVEVEARAVNNRHFKATVRCPPVLSLFEHDIEEMARERFRRGTLTIHVSLHRDVPAVTLNLAAAKEYAKALRRMAKDLGIAGEPDLSLIAGLPGVFETADGDSVLADEDFATVKEALGAAFDRLAKMRDREGANLKRDFSKRAARVASLVKEIRTRAPRVKEEYLERLKERVQRLVAGAGVAVNDRDLMRELAVFAERSDVTEELTRLLSHLDQFRHALSEEVEVGRRLDFLTQEMGREANTIAAKSGDPEVSRKCVDLKVELDRLKEQVQNVE